MYFYNGTTKAYIIAMSKIFSDVRVKRIDSSDTEIKDIKVPLIYSSKRKMSYALNTSDKSVSLYLPAMGFRIESLSYDSERKLSSLNEIRVNNSQFVFEAVPYKLNFSLTIKTKYQDDMWQILEQVLYYFKPSVHLNVKELPFSTDDRDVKITLSNVSLNFENDMDQGEDSTRELETELSFELDGNYYPSVMDDSIIEHIDINFENDLNKEIVNISHDFVDPNIVTTIVKN